MQTLTITHAKQNLGKWLKAAALGEDIGIVSGADIIALRKVSVESSDYAQREYGVTEKQLDRFAAASEALLDRHRAAGTLEKYVVDPAELLEKASHHSPGRTGKSRRSA
jgi:antitoxin (DNA-binding transcriptional repressor) of toxin-antitoxin stability system